MIDGLDFTSIQIRHNQYKQNTTHTGVNSIPTELVIQKGQLKNQLRNSMSMAKNKSQLLVIELSVEDRQRYRTW